VFENRVLRKIFGSKRDEVRGEWRTLNSGDLHGPCCLTNINRVIKSRRIWHVRDRRNIYRVLVAKPERKRPLGRRRLDGRIIL
jgi:hypothetical protein